MHHASPLSILWRLILAVSLATVPLAPMPAPDHAAAPVAEAATRPCHGDASPAPVPPPADDVPCDDGCCPLPDCDPDACRSVGPLLSGRTPPLRSGSPGVPQADFAAHRPSPATLGRPLRPPIA